jgi:hypothetical protein
LRSPLCQSGAPRERMRATTPHRWDSLADNPGWSYVDIAST